MASTSREWLLSEVEELIGVWESCECLWDVTSEHYKDKNKKKAAMTEIATKFETTVDEVAKKMKSLRAQHNREKNKVLAAKSSGAGTDDLPKVNWVHYDQLHFLDEVAGKRTATRSNLTNQSQGGEAEEVVAVEDIAEEPVEGIDDQLPEIRRSTKKPIEGKRMSKKRRLEESENTLTERATGTLERATMPDEIQAEKTKCAEDIFGQYVASELKSISDPGLKKIVKHRIQAVIFECTMPVQMTQQIAVSAQMGAQVSANQWYASSSALSPPPARGTVQSIPMRPFEPQVFRPQDMQEKSGTPSPFQGGPSPSSSHSPSASPSSPSSNTDSQTIYRSL